ncbi:F-box domain-containing protein [Mycena kentingensis (nom. inval.)]|nr:F-box domain-containing protein [Mycena kentingensis (nom. inval.)]
MSSKPAIFNSISAIDQRIEQLSAELLSVQTQRNNSVPFLKLPNEILCIIIEIHARECAPHRSRFSLHWIKTLLVCRRWYALAVTKQSLWANILIRAVSMRSLAREGFLRLQAERSGAAPLSLKAELYNEEYDLEWMASLFARLVSFDVSGQNAHIQDVIDRLPGNASFLAALKISANESGEGLGELVELPPEVLLQLRSLRVLSLHSVAYSWTAPRNLTALEMDRPLAHRLADDAANVRHVSGFVESNWRALLDLLPNLHSIQMKFSKEGAHRQDQNPDPEAVYTGMWLLRVLRANASLDASCRIRTLSLEVVPPYYGARELDLAWLARWLVELEAYVRVRREEFGRGSAALELIEIEDWEELLKRDGLEGAVSRLEGLMEGMGLLKRYRGIGPNAKVES